MFWFSAVELSGTSVLLSVSFPGTGLFSITSVVLLAVLLDTWSAPATTTLVKFPDFVVLKNIVKLADFPAAKEPV